MLKACLQTPINAFIINTLQCIFGYIFIITFFNRVFHAFYTVFRIVFRVVFLIVCIVIRFFIRCREDSRSDYFFSCLHSLFLAASSSFATGGGTLLRKLILITHHLIQIQASEISVLRYDKQVKVFNEMLQIFHCSPPLFSQQIQFVKIVFVFLLPSQEQYHLNI